MQGGYAKYSCFICIWDSRADGEHYRRKEWPPRDTPVPGHHDIVNIPLIPREKILLPPPHIKLGLIKQYVKAMELDSDAFHHMVSMFPKLSDAKLNAGTFVGPHIGRMPALSDLEEKMTYVEKKAWTLFCHTVHGFLGNQRSENFKGIIEDL